MKGRQKAAVLLIALGSQKAAEVLKHLSDREIEALSLEMTTLESVPPEMGDLVLTELAERVIASEAMGKGGVEYARSVLEHVFGPERAGEVLQVVRDATEGRPFDFIRRTPADQISTFLMGESPQTVVREVAQGLRDKLSNVLEHEYSSVGGVETLAELHNHAGRTTERNVLQTIGASHEDLAEEVRARLFTFEDLHRLADRELQLVLREVDQKDLALALRGVPDWLMEKITTNMSSRATELLREDIAAQAPQRKHVVEEAQGRIVAVVRRLEESGVIEIGGTGEDPEEEELV